MDQDIVLFEKQKRIYPRSVKGRYRRLKWLTMAALLGIYYLVPWIRWGRGPHAPSQAVLIDMPARRAYFFDIEIWPQEIYFLAGLLILAAVGLFFVTSLLGRVWCGYACPQTVWTDLFVAVEKWVQGDRNDRMKLDKGGITFEWIWKKAVTHFFWILIALCTGGAWVFYFVDAPTLLEQITHLNVPWMSGSWILGLTASTYIMAGFAREQVCTYMCPYARFQSAMFDRDTLIIGYDRERGEPRGKHKMGQSWEGRGHCIDCTQCVIVCPMGIDIRDGLQMECIACGLCVDACNDVMARVGLPPGLIRYDTQSNYEERTIAQKTGGVFADKLRLWRPRSLYYITIILLIGMVMLYAFFQRTSVELSVIHDRNPLFVKLSGGSIRNTYTVRIANKTHEDQVFRLSVEGLSPLEIKAVGAGEIQPDALRVLADSVAPFRIMVVSPPLVPSRQEVIMRIESVDGTLQENRETVFISEEY